MFHQLSIHLNKGFVGRKVLVGLCEMYASLLLSLGSEYVEKNYPAVITHFMNEFIANPRIVSTRQDRLLIRTLVGTLLRDLIGVRLLSEQGQIAAIQELSGSYLKRWPVLMPGQSELSALTLTVALIEVAGLLRQLGNSPPPVQVSFPLSDQGFGLKYRSGCPF
jgi:HEAT repeat-containing protein 5